MLNQSKTASPTPAVFERVFRKIEAAQPGASADHTREVDSLWMNPDVQSGVQRAMGEFLRLCSIAGNMHFLGLALERSENSSPAAVIEALGGIQRDLSAERDVVRAELRLFDAHHTAVRLRSRNHELAASDALRRAEERLSYVRRCLKSAPDEQVTSRQKLQSAGLSAADVAKIGVKPSEQDIAAWREEAATLAEQVERIGRFFASRPNYDTSILIDADLETLARWRERFPDTHVSGYRAV